MAAELDLHITMADLLAGWPAAREAVTRRGMACIGCPMNRFETLLEAATAYGVDPHELMREVAAGSATAGSSRTLRYRNDKPRRARHHSGHRRSSS